MYMNEASREHAYIQQARDGVFNTVLLGARCAP
jgi:hypothetical protein